MNVNLIKGIVGLVTSVGVGTIVANAIKSTTPEEMGKMARFSVLVGGIALSGIAAKESNDYMMEQIDGLNGWWASNKEVAN